MSELVITGTIKSIGEPNAISDKFRKLEFVLVTDGQYPKTIAFQVVNDGIDKFLKYNSEGQVVEVKFNIESKEYNGRYFTNATAWSIRNAKEKETNSQTPTAPEQNQLSPVLSNVPLAEGNKDDLPF